MCRENELVVRDTKRVALPLKGFFANGHSSRPKAMHFRPGRSGECRLPRSCSGFSFHSAHFTAELHSGAAFGLRLRLVKDDAFALVSLEQPNARELLHGKENEPSMREGPRAACHAHRSM
jgi:hypothetical protein